MRVTKIKTFILKVPLGENRFFSSQCEFPERNSLLVCIETDEGIVGWGEGGQYGPPEPVKSCIESVLAPLVLGRDPLETSVLWETMYAHSRDFGQKGAYIEAISAIDIALWDIKGKALNQPVHQLLGGAFRNSVTAYATGCYYRGENYKDALINLDQIKSEAGSYSDSGFKFLKIKIGLLDIKSDLIRVREIKKSLKDDIGLMVDCNHAYNEFTAIRIGRQLQDLDIHFIEEPVTPENYLGYQHVRKSISIPIAGGEAEYTRYGFERLINSECVDIIQPDVCVCGGITELEKIHTLANTRGLLTLPHVWGSGIALAAALQFIATIPVMPHTANPIPMQNEPLVEFDRNWNPLRDEILNEKFVIDNGKVEIFKGPGLGVTINEDTFKKYLVS